MLKDMLYIGLGGFIHFKEQVEKELKFLQEKGKITKEDSQIFLKNLYEKGEQEHNKHYDIMKNILKELIDDLGLVTKEDLEKYIKKNK